MKLAAMKMPGWGEELARRKVAEESLRESERHYVQLLAQSRYDAGTVAAFVAKISLAQEEERKQISRELHDEIAQTLAGINVYLAALKAEAAVNRNGFGRNIAHAAAGGKIRGHRASASRANSGPTVLDDLGFDSRAAFFHERIRQPAYRRDSVLQPLQSGLEELNGAKWTVLYRAGSLLD